MANTLSLLPIAWEIWGYYGIVGSRGWYTELSLFEQGSYGWLNLLSHPANSKFSWIYWIFIGGQIFFLVCGLFRFLPLISSIMIYFFTANLFHKGYLLFTGGEVLVNLVLFYLIFIQRMKPGAKKSTASVDYHDESLIQSVLSNVFFRLILIQLCVVYFVSSLYKLLDPAWLSGDALTYISRIEAYSCFPMEWLFSESPLFCKLVTWISLIYQIIFPIVVWFKRVKIPLLAFGTLFHLGIAFGMGIFTFGIVMILCYIPFLGDEHINRLNAMLRRLLPSGISNYFKKFNVKNQG